MEAMTKRQFVSRMMSDRAKVRREKIKESKRRDSDLTGYGINNRLKLEKRIRNMKSK